MWSSSLCKQVTWIKNSEKQNRAVFAMEITGGRRKEEKKFNGGNKPLGEKTQKNKSEQS